MKKFFYVVVVLYLVNFNANSQNTESNSYTIDFIFTGKVNPEMDSVFALRYKFLRSDFYQFNKLVIKSNRIQKVLSIDKIKSGKNIQVVHEDSYVYLIIKDYDKEDLPLATQWEDKKGIKQELNIRFSDGSIQSTSQFKQIENDQNSKVRQMRSKRK